MQFNELTIGVEIEVKGMSRTTARSMLRMLGLYQAGWRAKYDGTVGSYGCEIVSPVLQNDSASMLRAIRAICHHAVDRGAYVDADCGLHVHVGARHLSLRQFKNVCRQWVTAEEILDVMAAPYRRAARNHYWCRSNLYDVASLTGLRVPEDGRSDDWVELVHKTIDRIESATSIDALARAFTPCRYRKMNLQSWYAHGTIEFRGLHGTLDAEEIIRWIRVVSGLVHNSANRRARKPVKRKAPGIKNLTETLRYCCDVPKEMRLEITRIARQRWAGAA